MTSGIGAGEGMRGMSKPIAYLRDLDGTDSLHSCAAGDPGAVPVYSAEEIANLEARNARVATHTRSTLRHETAEDQAAPHVGLC